MASVVQIPEDDYIIKVQPGGTITLDTGASQGEVIFTGNFTVAGTQTIISSTNLDVSYNIITVNYGETGAGISLGKAGLRVDRGTFSDGQIIFDEGVSWTDPVTDTLIQGLWAFRKVNGEITAIQTNAINTNGGDLNLISEGLGVISVTGTNNYEDNLSDDDHIPNKKYVDDEIVNALTNTFQRRIEEGTTSKSFVEVRDQEVSGVPSRVNFNVDGTNVGSIFADRFEFGDIRITNNMIETTASDTPMILSAPGTGGIEILDNVTLTTTPAIDDVLVDPAAPTDGLKLYVKTPETGGTGLFFKHSNGNSSEVISRNNALLLSMLF